MFGSKYVGSTSTVLYFCSSHLLAQTVLDCGLKPLPNVRSSRCCSRWRQRCPRFFLPATFLAHWALCHFRGPCLRRVAEHCDVVRAGLRDFQATVNGISGAMLGWGPADPNGYGITWKSQLLLSTRRTSAPGSLRPKRAPRASSDREAMASPGAARRAMGHFRTGCHGCPWGPGATKAAHSKISAQVPAPGLGLKN